jgi:hypothetical protein
MTGLPEEAFQASIDLDIPGNSRSFLFFTDSLCTIEASIVASTELTSCCAALQYVLYSKITVFLDHLITEFICCCIPVEFIGIGNKHHQYIFFGETVFL